MRKPRIELGPTAWKAAILTIILFALVILLKHIKLYNIYIMPSWLNG